MQTNAMRQEQFEFEGLQVTYYRIGQGKPLLLVHGSGPGASSIGNWRGVLGPLAERYELFAIDLVGFGKSARKPSPPYFGYALWVRQAEAMLARIGGKKVGVIGHSLSGPIALTLASVNPRIGAVLTTGAMGESFNPTTQTRRAWMCPTDREESMLALRGLVHDASIIDEAYLAAREPVVFAPGYAAYFNEMFEGDPTRYIEVAKLSVATLAGVQCPVLSLHGREDLAFPPSSSIAIGAQLSHADVMLLADRSHSVAFERPDVFLTMAYALCGHL